jgi:flagellar basal body-associated protein FliL
LASGNASRIVVPIIIVLAALLIVVEILIPWLRKRNRLSSPKEQQNDQAEQTPVV